MKFSPIIDVYVRDRLLLGRMSSAWRIASDVRPTDAPPGNCTTTKNAPWSSSGRNPVGVIFASANDAGTGDRDHHQADDGEPHHAGDDRAVAVAHTVDRAHHPADRPAPRPVMRLAAARRTAPATASAR